MSVTIPSTVDMIDLSKPFNNSDISLWGHINKNSTLGYSPPTLNDGSIFATSSRLYLFGGALSSAIGAPTTPPQNGIAEYELSNDQWGQAVAGGNRVQRIHYGSAVQSPTVQVAYYMGGAITPNSDPSFKALPNAMPYMVQGLITIVEQTMTFENSSTTALNADGTAAGGFLALIEALGSRGILVSFGGFTNVPGAPMSLADYDLIDPSLHLSLGDVSIYDLGTRTWYQQPATGDIPPWRYNGCSVSVSAPDQSSHSIYIFGGWGNSFGGSDGNVYVLSIPSFRWIRVNQDSNRRLRHHCNLIGNHTMLAVGGIQPNGQDPQPQDSTGCDTTAMFTQGLGMFSLNSHTWVTNYAPSQGAAAYQVHPKIMNIIGGNENGSATVQSPVGGFTSQELGVLLKAHPEPNATCTAASEASCTVAAATTHAEYSPSHSFGHIDGLSTGNIAGIILAVLAIALVLSLVLFLLRRRYRRLRNLRPTISKPVMQDRISSELHAVIVLQELSDGQIHAHELGSPDKPLPPKPYDRKVPKILIQEMDADGSGIHPAKRDAGQRDVKE